MSILIADDDVRVTAGSPAVSPRVGLFGLIGSGNSGNDASTEAVLAYLRTAHPEVVVDAMCGGPELVRARYGIDGVPIFWYQKFEQGKTAVPAPLLKMCGKFVDTFRTARWARRHDAVIVPGAGALETTLPVHAWGFPYSLFVLSLSGKVFGTKVALVSVGADEIGKRITRWLSNSTARLACYRSYRDNFSRDTMRQRGVDTSADRVYPDLVFGVPTPPDAPGDPQLVGVGVMAYYGGNDDRQQADQIHSAYINSVTRFVRWLIDSGYRVRLFGGDAKFDVNIAEGIAADVRRQSPDLDDSGITVAPDLQLRGTHAGYGTVRHGRGDALPQRDVRPQARQAHHLARLLTQVRRVDGEHGAGRFHPVGQLTRRGPADRAVQGDAEPSGRAPAAAGGAQRGQPAEPG